MKSFETFTTVEPQGDIRVAGVPFAPGTEVEVVISPKRRTADDFLSAWERVCSEMRNLPSIQSITDRDIQHEIDDYRAGR